MSGYTKVPGETRAKSNVTLPLRADPPDGPAGPALLVDHLSARYPRAPHPALSRVDLRVEPGEVAAVLGPNGSGKSTLLRVVAGIVEPSEGAVHVAGRGVVGLDRRVLARLVAFVPQSETVALGFRVREVVAMGRAPHQTGWMRAGADDDAIVDEAMTRCDLVSLAGRRVEELSGGEQRRVAVARALAQRPRVLLLDEPAAFLDVRHRLELYDLLADLARRDRVACLVSMHELDAAARIASQVLLLRDGRVVAAGETDHVMTPGRLREAFDAPIDVSVHAPTGQRYFIARR
jgi:iron complex transport system ATP-binding protein